MDVRSHKVLKISIHFPTFNVSTCVPVAEPHAIESNELAGHNLKFKTAEKQYSPMSIDPLNLDLIYVTHVLVRNCCVNSY